jgi:hypothetical protein
MSRQPIGLVDLDDKIDNFMSRKAKQHPDLRLTFRD